MKKILKKVLLIILSIYLLLNIFLFLNQKNMLYFPDKTDFFKCDNFTEKQKKNYTDFPYRKNELLINKVRFYEVPGNKNNVIIFFHGNAGRACNRTGILKMLKKTGNTVILVEYFGYADSYKNSANISDILKNVKAIGNYIRSKKFDKIYVMGRSLGTGPASYFSKNFKTDKLLLVSAYDKLYKVGAEKYPIFPIKYLFTQNYNSIDYLENYKKDFLLIHGKQDKVIPYKHGLELYNNLENSNKKIISLKNANHHNILDNEIEEIIIDYFK